MSEHPYGYSPYPGQQPRSQPQSHQSQIHAPFSQSSPSSVNLQPSHYGSFQQPNPTPGNYATLNNSYQYNTNNIPGLGMSNSIPPVSYRPDTHVAWHPQPPAAQHHLLSTQTQEKTPAATSKQGNTNPSAMETQGARPSQPQVEYTLEEGELSEGEFDDLYEPDDSIESAAPVPPSQPPSTVENRNGSVGDADGSSIYDDGTPQGEVVINSTSTSLPVAEQEYSPDDGWEPADLERERSGSYSPYLSPREIQRRVSVSKPAPHGARPPVFQNPSQPLPGINITLAHQPLAQAPLSNGASYSGVAAEDYTTSSSVPSKDPAAPAFRSVAEAKKKAQEAILGLWPLKVRYQDYIEEGFDEKMIKGLFTDLGLEASIPKAVVIQKATVNSQGPAPPTPDQSKVVPKPQDSQDEPSTTTKPKQPATIEKSTNPSTISDTKKPEKTAAEERKDKIARKLAAKAQKTVPVVQPPAATPPSQSTPAGASAAASANLSPAKAKTRAENNAILHQKLAALKKAQEKAVAEKKLTTESPAKPATPPTVPASVPVVIPSYNGHEESPMNSIAAIIPAPEPSRRSVSTEKSLPKDGSIPGLSLTTQQAPSANRNLKRPVASDFDNYPTPVGTLKRTRTQETLIIDISDDEDVEMDIGSPIDEPMSPNEIANPPLRQTPLGAFPPLSDSPNWKQRSSPASSTMPTPPVRGAKLDLLHKRIEETKRRIAEAEAKKAAKRTNAVHSPEPQPLAVESTTLPNPAVGFEAQEETKRVDIERRDRIVSYELPTVEAVLREKQDRLKEAVAQAAQLELEIQASLEEQRKLTEEIQTLGTSPGPIITEMGEQIHPILSAATAESDHVVMSQLPNGQESDPEHVDISMTNGEDVNRDHEVVSNEIQQSSGLSQPDSTVSNQPAAVDVQSPQNLGLVDEDSRAETSNDNVMLESTFVDMSTETIEPDLNTMVGISEHEVEGPDHNKASTPEQSIREGSSPNNDGSYRPDPAPISPTRNVTTPEPKIDANKASSLREQSTSLVNEQPSLNETSPPQSAAHEMASSAPENPIGEVQNSSSHEHLLLTSTQDEPEQRPQVEDLLSYHSPLGYFRAYRFHPKYFDEVAGGLKSMTYSSRIDPMQPLCPRVLAGEHCPDGNACEFQHFESMVLQDAEIITQLGSADMFTGETRNRFIDGLKRVLNELKANRVKDFDRITKAIVKHRQEFLEDKSKVLLLDAGTS
ncbi:hypothetical protein F4677DRAFT_410119 [Hypoxylon crocopeplum]|nr:hypothetical protein F4677DRAFT_410119 [Hypoxylon crocopeplum]